MRSVSTAFVDIPFSWSWFTSASVADGFASAEEEEEGGVQRRRTHLTVGPLVLRTFAMCSPLRLAANSVDGSMLL